MADPNNQINVGTINTPNPSLWVDLNNPEASITVYTIASVAPGPGWISVNQFCSLLSLRWLLGGRGTNPYGLSNIPNPDKITLAHTLIGYKSLQDQVNTAVSQLGGAQQDLATVTTGVQGGGYKPGTKIWAGNDYHVVAIYIVDATDFELYDPNTGASTKHKRSTFNMAMTYMDCNAFVVH